MSRLTRYVLRQLIVATILVTGVLAGAVWLSQSLRLVDLIVNRGLPFATFIYLASLTLPTFLALVLPIAVFSAIMFIYYRLIMDSEIVVMRAAGLSQTRLARPAIVLALLATALGYALSLYFVPASFRQFKDLQNTIRSDYSSVLLQEGVFNTMAQGVTVYVRTRKSDGELHGVIVHDARNAETPITMMAERGALVRTDSGPRVVLVNGNRQEVKTDTGQLSLLYFDQYTVDLSNIEEAPERSFREARERFLDELFWPDNPMNERYYRKLRAEGHQRLAGPLLPLGFTLIALATLLTGDFSRRGQTRRVILAILIIVAFEAAALGFQNLAAKYPPTTPLIYLNALAPIVGGLYLLVTDLRRRPRTVEADMWSA